MNKMKYVAPAAEKIIINNDAILAGSINSTDKLSGYNSKQKVNDQGFARSPLATDVWEDIDETNGNK